MNPQFTDLPVRVPEILLPNPEVDLTKWAVVACDQFTSQKDYWEKCKEIIGSAPSTLRLIYPEVYLGDRDEERIAAVRAHAENYLSGGVFRAPEKEFVLVERSTPFNKARLGLVASIDLEAYSFEKGAKPLIRATEATIAERIPPRVKIREGNPIELPHVLLLLDDEKRTVIEPLFAAKKEEDLLYDFDLMQGGGHLRGWRVPERAEASVFAALGALLDPARLSARYGEETPFLFAVGDGNHSLATAKTCWERLKPTLSAEEQQSHPARFALVEIENVYDDGLKFEPIFRLVTGVDAETFFKPLKREESFFHPLKNGEVSPCFAVSQGKKYGFCKGEDLATAIRTADEFIASRIKECGGKVDYVHGESDVLSLAEKTGGIAFLFPPMQKQELFPGVAKHGSLPKKTFSMGEAVEKRYYLEAKAIR